MIYYICMHVQQPGKDIASPRRPTSKNSRMFWFYTEMSASYVHVDMANSNRIRAQLWHEQPSSLVTRTTGFTCDTSNRVHLWHEQPGSLVTRAAGLTCDTSSRAHLWHEQAAGHCFVKSEIKANLTKGPPSTSIYQSQSLRSNLYLHIYARTVLGGPWKNICISWIDSLSILVHKMYVWECRSLACFNLAFGIH